MELRKYYCLFYESSNLPIEVCESWWVPKTFGERITIDLQSRYLQEKYILPSRFDYIFFKILNNI